MVIGRQRRARGWMLTEFVVAAGILVLVVMPLAYSFFSEIKLCRAYYYRAVAMEVVDGELEVLVAGEHARFGEGTHEYEVETAAARGLPGRFVLVVGADRVSLEWLPEKPGVGGRVRREAQLK